MAIPLVVLPSHSRLQLPARSATFPTGDTAVTDSSGVATDTITANTAAGAYGISASASGVSTPASFSSLTNTADVASMISVTSGDNQSATVNTPYSAPLVVTVTDQFGNPVSGESVTFAAPGAGASGTFPTGATVTTGANGQATDTLTANTVAGTFGVTATAAAIPTPAGFSSLTNTADVPAFVTATSGDNQNTTVNTAFSAPWWRRLPISSAIRFRASP